MAARTSTTARANGILNLLAAEHGEIATLMSQILDDETSSRRRAQLYAELRAQLMLHARAEELEFYAECRSDPHLRTMADESLDDHQEMEQLLVELDREPSSAGQWLDTFEKLQAMVEEHVEFEENEVFPRVREYFDTDQLAELEAAYQERKELLEAESDQLEPHERPSA